MKTVIAEKPSVAREIARLLGAFEKKDGYLKGNGYQVTWAFGHLVGLAMPKDYGLQGFRKENLPILPNPFQLRVRKLKKENRYSPDPRAAKQLKVIGQLFKNCDSIIVATDAGREGELIFRYIYEYFECDKPFQRLWISSLTEKAIRHGFDNLKPGSYYDGLYRAAQSRSRADWLVGINASQALSIAAGNGIYSLGRVQTPMLVLICKRFLQNKKFTVKKYFQIQLEHRKGFMDFKSLSKTKWDDKRQAENALRGIQRNGKATIVSTETKNMTEHPPLLFDLTGLQKEANNKLNLSAKETLNIAQGLYENKFITYPRTRSKYIPEDIWPEIPSLVRALQDKENCKQAISKMKWGQFNKHMVNDSRVTDHHGLLTTEKIPSALSIKENAIYNMIAFRLLESLSKACLKETTNIVLLAGYYEFITKGQEILEPGWRAIKGHFTSKGTDPRQQLPGLHSDDELKIMKASVLEKKTTPPLLYTEASLLSTMETTGKQIGNEKKHKGIQNSGIGTPATRATIIETLFKRHYIRKQKRSLIPTKKGLQVYGLVKDKKIANVAMTAEWELVLQKIENKKAEADIFQEKMKAYASSITDELLQTSIPKDNLPKLVCPKCKKHYLFIEDKIVKCSSTDCNWTQFRKVCGVQIGIADIENLVNHNKTSLIKGMKSRSGKMFNAHITLNDKAESSFLFENNKSRSK